MYLCVKNVCMVGRGLVVGFEFVAAQFNIADEVKAALNVFWGRVCNLPELTDWKQAVDLTSNVLSLIDG